MRSNLPHKVSVQRNTPPSDGKGGGAANWQTHIEEYHCRMYQRSGGLARPELGKLDIYTHKFIGEIADVCTGDRFIMGGGFGEGRWDWGRFAEAEHMVVVECMPIHGGNGPHHLEGKLRRVPRR